MICIDSDFIIAMSRGDQKAVNMVSVLEERDMLATTAINYFEVLSGAMLSDNKEKRMKQAYGLLDRIEILELDKRTAELASKIHAGLVKKGTPIPRGDLLIGSIVLSANADFVTRNAKDFERIPGLKVIKW